MHNNNNNCQSENSGSRSEVNNSCQPENSSPQSECMSPKSAEEEYATVHMLQAARLPGKHEKLVKLQFNKQDVVNTGDFLLESDQSTLHQLGLDMESTLLNFDKDGCATVPVCNYNMDPKHLDKGQVVGKLYPVTLEGPEVSERTLEPANVRALNTTESSSDDENHWEKLCKVLQVSDDSSGTKPNVGDISKFYQMLKLYANVFVFEDGQLGSTNVVTHSINTGDSPPIKQPVRRIPFALRRKVEELVDDMLQKKVIHPSKSPWASPVVLVAKKNGDTRFCVDYRRLNSVTKMDVYPLPRIDDMLDSLSEARVFSTLDLASGFWQVEVERASQEKTAFITHHGLFEFEKMPFGLSNAPATFQRLMETVLAGLVRNICYVYLDDILIIGKTFEEHLKNIARVLDRLQEAGLKLKPSKCHFLLRQVQYLGHTISDQGISPDASKIEAVKSFPEPTDLKSLRSFLGLASYYRRFIPGFSAVANPLFKLTRKNVNFCWSVTCQEAFERLKQLLVDTPLLIFPNFSRGFVMETDTSGVGLGAVLAQQVEDGTLHPVAYASRTLQTHEQNYGATELEALGVVWAAKHFRHYLYEHKCVIYTDHEALKSLLNTPYPSGKLARWGLILQDMDLEIKYRSGKKNSNADALSRYPIDVPTAHDTSTELSGVVATLDPSGEVGSKDGENTLHDRQMSDSSLKIIVDYISDGKLPEDEKEARHLTLRSQKFTVLDGILYYIESDKTLRVVVPQVDREHLFNESHSGTFGAHLRGAKIHSQLSRHYWWPKMRADIEKWCRSCLVCATRHVGHKVIPPLTPIPVGGPFDRVGVDVLQLPKTRSGKQYAVVFVDYLTKWPEVFATSNQSAYTIAKLLVEKIVSRHGVPSQLLSDRGGAFLSKLLQEIGALLGFYKVNTSAYHPQTDGLVERFNRTLIDMLAKTTELNGKNWDEKLPFVLFAYRSTVQESTGESPFRLLYGRDPKLPTEDALSCPVDRTQIDLTYYKTEVSSNLTEAWKLAQERIKKAQTHQKKQHDKFVRNNKFAEGDAVFLYDPSLKTGKAYKFAKPFRGPYKIIHLVKGGAEIQLVAKPKSKLICVALNRLRHCPREISNSTDSESEAQSGKQLRKSTSTADNVSTNDDLVAEDCESFVPVEEPAISGSAEESTLDLPAEVPTTVVQAEQSMEDEATGDKGNRWKDCLRPRRRKKKSRRGRALKGRGCVTLCY